MKMHFFLSTTLVFFSFLAGAKTQTVTSQDLSKESLMIELTGKDYKNLKEEELYAEIVTAYRNQNVISMKARSLMFLKKFPHSHFADNVLYLAGLTSLQTKNYPEALRSFQRISKEYPNGNKFVAAQFSKAMTYKFLNLNAEAKRVLKDVMTKYPGSPESFRAEAELKLIN